MSDAFSHIIGHAAAVQRLRLMLKNDRVPHAILISGSRHVGKEAISLAIARALLGAQSVQSHPDFRMLVRGRDEKTGKLRKNISVEEIRELRDHLRLSSFLGGRKIAVVDEVETLSDEAQNALLKTLEEPSAKSHIILISHDIGGVLPTVRSRSAAISLSRVHDHVIRESAADADEEESARITRFAAGRPGVAVSLRSDSGMVDWYSGEERRWNELRSSPIHRRFALVSSLAPSGGDREETVNRLRELLGFWETTARGELLSGSASAARALRGLFRLRRSLEANVQPRLLLERFVLEL